MPAIRAFAQQIDIAKANLVGPARRQLMVATAIAARDQALATDTAILGKAPAVTQIVDGTTGAPLESVKPGGTIVFLFAVGAPLLAAAFDLAIETASRLSPVLTGRFRRSFRLLVNDVERDASAGAIQIQEKDILTLVNLQPYTRKIERMDGVFESTAAVLRSRYGGIVDVNFTYRSFPGFEVGRSRTAIGPRRRKGVTAEQRAARATRRLNSYPVIELTLK